MHQSQNFKVTVSQSWLLYQTKSLQKELGFFLQNYGTAQFFVFNRDFGGFQWGNGPILNIMLENDLNMIDLVLTHLTHPWGPPWTLETLGDHWRPLATMLENNQWPSVLSLYF